MPFVRIPRRLGTATEAFDHELDRDFSGSLENKGTGERLALSNGLLQARQHCVRAARLQRHRFAGRDGEPLRQRTHLRDAVVNFGGVELEAFRDFGRSADERIRLGAIVGDRHISGTGCRDRWCRPGPRMIDDEIARLELMGGGRPGQGTVYAVPPPRCSAPPTALLALSAQLA